MGRPRRHRAGFVAGGLAALLAAAPAAAAGGTLHAVLRVAAPHDLNPEEAFPVKDAIVVIVEGEAALADFLGEDGCRRETDHPRCQPLARLEPGRGRCLAVMLDTGELVGSGDPGTARLGDYRVAAGPSEAEARRRAVLGSNVFDRLYWGQRLTDPLRTIGQIADHVLAHEEDWIDRIVATRCPSGPAVSGTSEAAAPK